MDIFEVLEGITLSFKWSGHRRTGRSWFLFFAGPHGVSVTSVLYILTARTQGMLRESFHLLWAPVQQGMAGRAGMPGHTLWWACILW